MEIQILDIINVITPIMGIVVGWFVGRRKQKNDFLSELQASIDLLAEKNRQQMEEIVKLRQDIVVLRQENSQLREEIEQRLKIKKPLTKCES